MKSRPYILVDAGWIAHRARFAMKGYDSDDLALGVTFGILEQLRTLMTNKILQSNKLMLFLDSKKSSRRRLFPAYKQKRKENRTDEDINDISIMYERLDIMVRDLLPQIGFPIYLQTGLESDDLIAQTALTCLNDNKRGVMVTGDKDLLQCISPRVSWFDPSRWKYITYKKYIKENGIQPEQYGEVKAIAGCETDNVPGIKGVAEKTAIKYLKGQLPEHHKTYQRIISKEGQEKIKLYRKLVKLPYKRTKPIELPTFSYDISKFYDLCEQFGLSKFMSGGRMDEWEMIFNGNIQVEEKKKSKRRKRKPRKRKRGGLF